ncbi:hypothetical protein [Mechercharimyces sp. CAU 1602]|uniref:hypothetical protein n=1 Tax=Mechercharimyces sp. CAU 1602 TaxID=2973933 RepID=UPI002161B79E|nr:hypothetical protein [Mechercharimyces sp. CAU 1602]MCS1351136.1 hypothetical protein [Mechercharimyces sp. CAU 1602]
MKKGNVIGLIVGGSCLLLLVFFGGLFFLFNLLIGFESGGSDEGKTIEAGVEEDSSKEHSLQMVPDTGELERLPLSVDEFIDKYNDARLSTINKLDSDPIVIPADYEIDESKEHPFNFIRLGERIDKSGNSNPLEALAAIEVFNLKLNKEDHSLHSVTYTGGTFDLATFLTVCDALGIYSTYEIDRLVLDLNKAISTGEEKFERTVRVEGIIVELSWERGMPSSFSFTGK